MNHNIELEFKKNAEGAYNVVFRSSLEGEKEDKILEATVPRFDPDRYVAYQKACRQQYRKTRLGLKELHVWNPQDLDEAAANVLDTMNSWGKLPQFVEIADAIESRSENLRVTISTECTDIRRLPFHKWQLFPDNVEVVFSRIEAQKPNRERHPDRIRILVILGDDTDIDIKEDRQAISDYCGEDAELVFLAQPDRATLTATLVDALGWDIIFFSGHSSTDDNRMGRICINATDSLTMDELRDVFAPAISKRVQIAIFNSCDGLGITPILERLNIDRLIVMREPIPDKIAQEFLKSFLKAFTCGARFDDAVKSARQQLVASEDEYPYASWLPIVVQNRLVTSPTWQSLGKIRSPYKGLEAFEEKDAANFYGREETIERYAKLVAQNPLMPIIGASGSGKSSLVQAGLIPLLKQDPERQWQILTMRPRLNPFNSLAKTISNNRSDLETLELDIELASDRHILTQKLAQMRLPNHRILLFIDQFEEIFTQSSDLSDETGQQKAEQKEADSARQIFLQSLADAVRNAPNFVLVFTLRNDFLPTLQGDLSNSDFNELLTKYGLQLLGKINGDSRRAIVTKPVEKLNVKFEDGLVDRLLQDVGDGDGTLPLLQLVLDKLWDTQEPRLLTNAGYKAICGNKGVKAILAERAEEIYGEFVEPKKIEQFREVFFNLVSLGDGTTGTTRRIATLTEIGEKNWHEIVVPLSKSTTRLLKTDADEKTKEATVEIIHESLIQHWRRLENWIVEYHDELERIVEIKVAAMKWDKNNRSKQDLWQGKKLKEAKKSSKDSKRVISIGSIVNDFLVACTKQQRWNRGRFVALGLIVPGIVIGALARNYIIQSSVLNINITPKNQCDHNRLSTAFQFLTMMKYELKRLDLKQRDLRCVNLSGTDLNHTDLSGANLSKTDLSGANLRGANLTKANLSEADLRSADLRGADAHYRGADLRDADLRHANLSFSNLSFSNLSNVKLGDTDLSNANLGFADLSGSNFGRANLNHADLTGVNFNSPNHDLGIEEVKFAKNWDKAKYSQQDREELGLK